jgi:hypothetical protein
MTKIISAFRNFGDVPKRSYNHLSNAPQFLRERFFPEGSSVRRILLFYLTGLNLNGEFLMNFVRTRKKKKSYTCTKIVFLTNFMV